MRNLLALAMLGLAAAEDGLAGWLRYAPLEGVPSDLVAGIPGTIVVLGETKGGPLESAGSELKKGLNGILGKDAALAATSSCDPGSVIVGTVESYQAACGDVPAEAEGLEKDGFFLSTAQNSTITILGQNDRGALYGAFEYLSMLAQGNFSRVAYSTSPAVPIRWGNHWDNLSASGSHGSVERGYAGPSLFFSNGGVLGDLSRLDQYGKLLASIRVNGIIVNNVNADAQLLNDRNIDGLGRIAEAFRPWGIQVGISLNFASPQSFGLSTFDPLNQQVINWWTQKTDQIYKRIPDFAGYLVKANSEGQPGPLTYQRTLADGANMFAKALKPHGGVIMFRAFVYNQLSYNDRKADRANAAVEFFKPLDGKFDDNVVVQIKYGPIDFQVREPASPLFANLPNTNAAIELQITQEYLGQQCHLVYLPPLWKTILDFDMKVGGQQSYVKDILKGQRPAGKRPLGGFAGVINAGQDKTWLGSHLAMSNLYAFGRLAWNPSDDPEAMLQDWTRLTFGRDQGIIDVISQMSMLSWPAYENYTGNLGVQTLTDITGNHYGPNPASQDGNGWGQWTRADRQGIGMDRTSTGTGNAQQYPPEVASKFQNVDTTPEPLILWFHHLPWTYKLSTGETIIQHFYNAHYAGAETAQAFPLLWMTVEDKVDAERYEHVLHRLEYQAGHSIVWRDFINMFYNKMTGIKDELGRVGNHPQRVEAESMTMSGYSRAGVNPSEAASGGTVATAGGGGFGFGGFGGGGGGGGSSLSATISYDSGTYNVGVGYFDVSGGVATWTLSVGDKDIGTWKGDNEQRLGKDASGSMDGGSASRVMFRNVTIEKGQTVKVQGQAGGSESAPVDYVVFIPEGGPLTEAK